jgi:hypothetical protein
MNRNNSSKSTNLKNDSNEVPLKEYIESKNLDIASVLKSDSNIILLPNNDILGHVDSDENHYSSVTKDVMIVLQENNMNVSLYDDGKEKREVILYSATPDVYIPIMIFLKDNAMQIALSIISAWIYDKYIKKGENERVIEYEFAEVDLETKKVKWNKIKGPASEVQEIIASTAESIGKGVKYDTGSIVDNSKWKTEREQNGKESFLEAERLIESAETYLKNGKLKESEKLYRKSLAKISEASLWDPKNEKYKKILYNMGKLIHDTFGCAYRYEDHMYHVECPIVMSQSGLFSSIGGSAKPICSICGNETLECSHVSGKTYNNVLAQKIHGICNICRKKECEHVEGARYDSIEAFNIINDLKLDHIAIVDNPAIPVSVATSYSIPESDFLKRFSEEERDLIRQGAKVFCERCSNI